MATDDHIGINAVAAVLGVSKQRADTISKTDPAFPAPVAEGRRGQRTWRLWSRAAVERYGKASGRIEPVQMNLAAVKPEPRKRSK